MKLRSDEPNYNTLDSFMEPATTQIEQQTNFPRFSHFIEDEPMKIVPKSRSRVTVDDEDDNIDTPIETSPYSDPADENETSQNEPRLEPLPKMSKPRGNPFAKKKADESLAIKKIVKTVVEGDEPEKKKRRTKIDDFVVRKPVIFVNIGCCETSYSCE